MPHMFQTFAQRAAEMEQKDPHKMRLKDCSCGSGLERHAFFDARGIFMTYICEQCMMEKLSHFRPEIITDPNYSHDEPIDEEE
jgi:hypothetical protein